MLINSFELNHKSFAKLNIRVRIKQALKNVGKLIFEIM